MSIPVLNPDYRYGDRRLLARLCAWLTRHRWKKPVGDWSFSRAPYALWGRVWWRNERCVICGAGSVFWQERRPAGVKKPRRITQGEPQ